MMLDRRGFLATGLAGLAAGAVRGGMTRGAAGPAEGWAGEGVDAVATLDQPGWAQAVTFAPDGKTLAAAGFAAGGIAPSWITTWEVGTWKRLGSFAVPDMRIDRLAFAPGGKELVAAGRDESHLIVCRADSGECRTIFRRGGTGGMPAPLAFSPDGRYLVWTNDEEGVTLWVTAGWVEVQRLVGTRTAGFEVVVDPSRPWEGFDGRAYALGHEGTLYRMTPVADRPRDVPVEPGVRYVGPPQWGLHRVGGIERPWSTSHLTLARSGKMAAWCASDVDGKVGRIATFALGDDGTWTPRAATDPLADPHLIYSLAFTPDGRALVAGGGLADCQIRRWAVATGRALAPLAGHKNSVVGLATSAAGWLASAGNADGTVRVWAPRREAR